MFFLRQRRRNVNELIRVNVQRYCGNKFFGNVTVICLFNSIYLYISYTTPFPQYRGGFDSFTYTLYGHFVQSEKCNILETEEMEPFCVLNIDKKGVSFHKIDFFLNITIQLNRKS